jgi:hypothetical protein
MCKVVLTMMLAVLLIGCGTLRHQPTDEEKAAIQQEKEKAEEAYVAKVIGLASIKKIYLGDFGNANGSDLIREKVRIALSESTRFEVVENPKSADAVLTGVASVEKRYSESVNTDNQGKVQGTGDTTYFGQGVLRVVDIKKEKTVWNFEYQRGFFFGESVSSNVSNQLVDKLLEDAKIVDNHIVKNPAKVPATNRPPATNTQSATDKLKELDSMHKQGLITDSEYASKKQKILKSM